MFSNIDNKVIKGFQWMVRQIELYTHIHHKDLLGCGIITGAVSIVIGALPFFFYFLVHRAPLILLMHICIIVYVCAMYIEICKEYLLSIKTPTALPGAILRRKLPRAFEAMIFSSFMSAHITLIWDGIPFRIFPFVYYSWFLGLLFFILILEYLICTVGLLPGEKERKKAEQELRNERQSFA
jgi:hypothetical protein